MMHYFSFLHVYSFDFDIIAFLNINNFDRNGVFILIEKMCSHLNLKTPNRSTTKTNLFHENNNNDNLTEIL